MLSWRQRLKDVWEMPELIKWKLYLCAEASDTGCYESGSERRRVFAHVCFSFLSSLHWIYANKISLLRSLWNMHETLIQQLYSEAKLEQRVWCLLMTVWTDKDIRAGSCLQIFLCTSVFLKIFSSLARSRQLIW